MELGNWPVELTTVRSCNVFEMQDGRVIWLQ